MAKNFAQRFRTHEKLVGNIKPAKHIENEVVSTNRRTTNYDWFDVADPTNRDLDENNLNRLLKSFTKKQVNIPISVVLKPGKQKFTKGCFETRDGQHRVYICKLLGLPVVYNIVDNFEREDVSLVNSANKPWAAKDYLNKFMANGIEDYKNFYSLIEPHSDWEMKIFFDILNERTNEKSITSQSFKRGELSLKHEEMDNLRKKVRKLVKFDEFSKSGHTRRYLFGAIISLLSLEDFDDMRLCQKIKTNQHKLQYYDRLTALNSVVEIYNKGLSTAGGRVLPTIVGSKILDIQMEPKK